MTTLLPLSIAAFVSVWLLFFTALHFYEEGDDRRSLLLFAIVVFTLLAGFTMLVPTETITQYPPANIISNGILVQYPAQNVTNVNPPFSNSVDVLYTAYIILQAFIFFVFFIWSIRHRLQYQTTKQYEDEMAKNRRHRGLG